MGKASKIWMHAKMLRFDRVAFVEGEPAPHLEFTDCWQPDSQHLRDFLDICPGWRHPEFLPPTYPQVALAELHSKILASREFPFNPMGIVHVSNSINVHRALSMAEALSLDVRASLENWQPHRRGRVFDIRTEIKLAEELVWESRATALVMTDKNPSGPRTMPSPEPMEAGEDRIHLAEDLGRRYARVAGDYNPIHQRAWMARPFGFKRAIIHGMWTLGWALHEPASRAEPGPLECIGYFKRPVSLPGDIWRSTEKSEDGRERIVVYNLGSSKPCLEASLSVDGDSR